MPGQRVVFRSVIEALYERALREEVTPALRARLRSLGLDLAAPLPVSLPVPIFAGCLYATVEELFPGLPPFEGMRTLGSRLGRSYWDTALGRSMAGLLRLLGPHRSLSWLGRLFRATDSYSEVAIHREGPHGYEVHFNAPDVPEGYVEGLLEEVLRTARAPSPRVERVRTDATGTLFRIRWAEA